MVETSVKKVQHLTGGIVGEILVKEGSEVEAGQVLMRLDYTLTRATLGIIRSQLDLYEAREAQLRERIAQLGEEISGLTAQQQSKDGEIRYIGEEL